MKTYFDYKNFKVIEFKDQDFARYEILDFKGNKLTRVFSNYNQAVLYCIGVADGCTNDSKLMSYVDTFVTMVNK